MRHRTVPLLLSIAAAALVATPPAVAGPPSPRELHREIRGHVHDVLRELGRVPDRIHARHRDHLQVFFGGSSYYPSHRHHHTTYHFPVRVQSSVVYRPYHYCDDVLYGSPGVRLELGFGGGYGAGYPGDAIWCDHCRGRFPRGHGHFSGDAYRYRPVLPRPHYDRDRHRPRYRSYAHDRGDHRGCDHDRYDRRRHDDRRDRYDRKGRHRDDDDRDDDRRRHRRRGRDD